MEASAVTVEPETLLSRLLLAIPRREAIGWLACGRVRVSGRRVYDAAMALDARDVVEATGPDGMTWVFRAGGAR